MKIGGKRPKGDIVTTKGEKVSEHDGVLAFTVGQRRGLHIGGTAEPMYVVEVDAASNTVIVGEKHELEKPGFSVQEFHSVNPALLKEVERGVFPIVRPVVAQVRSRHRGVPATLSVTSPSTASVSWGSEWAPVSPGQAAVLYDLSNTEVLGGGRISA